MEHGASEYLKKGARPLTSESSVLVSSSKYLNSSALRHVVAQEMLRKPGLDLPPEYFIPEIMAAFDEVFDPELLRQLFQSEREKTPRLAQWLDERFLSRHVPEDLQRHREGTLGNGIFNFITRSGFEIDFMFKGKPLSDHDYWVKRFVQTHDIQHMVVGFDVTPIGEYGLIAFNTTEAFRHFSAPLAAELSRQPMFSMSCGLMQANLHDPSSVPELLAQIARGRDLALRVREALFYVKWERYLDCTLQEIRDDLGLTEH